MQAGQHDVTNALLRVFYPRVTPLSTLLPPSTVRDTDPDAFRTFLDATVVGSHVEIVLGGFGEDEEALMKDVINKVHKKLFAAHSLSRAQKVLAPGEWWNATPPNIICLGYRPADDRADAYSLSSGLAITNHFANTNVNHLRQSANWKTLVTRVGLQPLITLFSAPRAAVFAPLPNACYLQLSGQAVSELTPISRAVPIGAFRASLDPVAPVAPTPAHRTHRSAKRRRGKKGSAQVTPAPPKTPVKRTVNTVPTQSTELPPPAKRPKLAASTSAPQLDAVPRQVGILRAQRPGLRPSISESVLYESPKRKAAGEADEVEQRRAKRRKPETLHKPNTVIIVRTRLYHARPFKTSLGQVAYGFSPRHIFSRLPILFPVPPGPGRPPPLDRQTRHLIKYIFPRQFCLDNAFTTPKLLWGALPDYGDREVEIETLGPVKTPKRLKPALALLERLIKLQARCNYRKLLDKFCPRKVQRENSAAKDASQIDSESVVDPITTPEPRTQISRADISIEVSQRSLIYPHGAEEARAKARAKPTFAEYLCTPYEVKSFVRAVIRDVVPKDFWGSDANEEVILKHISALLGYRRYETVTVHALLQGFTVSDCDWLRPPSAGAPSNKLQVPNEIEMKTRRGLLEEFLFWFVDGFLFDLLRTTFMMTESAKSRNRTLFFRQDDWDVVCKPLLVTLQQSMFDELPKTQAERILRSRTLGFSYLRLLPKDTGGVRPIMNLQRKPKLVGLRGQLERGKSINQHLQSTFYALSYESTVDPKLLGASVQGETQIYQRIKTFKSSLQVPGKKLPKLYFVKVDVKACFDTIKQNKLLEIVEAVLKQDAYVVQKYSRVTSPAGKVSRKWARQACPDKENWSFPDAAATLTDAIRHAVFADGVVYPKDPKSVMLRLLREHVQCNLVKIGGRYFRQRDGIPQGSILSSFLCSLFYAHMERAVLRFTRDQSSLLLRYIDDFLFVTTKRPLASRFLRVMQDGIPEYGCFIAADKRLTNFAVAHDGGASIPTHTAAKDFPWCGMTINTATLEVKAEIGRYDDVDMSDTLTVQRFNNPGQAFLHKMLETCKARAHLIYNDTAHNSLLTVYLNIYQSFLLSALKFNAYIREWGSDPRKQPAFFLGVYRRTLEFMFVAIKNRSRNQAVVSVDGTCSIKRDWVLWLGAHAFHRVLRRKPTLYSALLPRLARDARTAACAVPAKRLRKVVDAEENQFIGGPTWRR